MLSGLNQKGKWSGTGAPNSPVADGAPPAEGPLVEIGPRSVLADQRPVPGPRRSLNWFHSRHAPRGRPTRYTDCCRRGSRPSERWCPCARFANMVAGGCDLVIGDRFAGSRWGICSFARSPPAPRRHVFGFQPLLSSRERPMGRSRTAARGRNSKPFWHILLWPDSRTAPRASSVLEVN